MSGSPGIDVLDEVKVWDDVTAGVVLARLGAEPHVMAFFTPEEVAIAEPLVDHLLDRTASLEVPVLAVIDARLADR